MPVLLTQEFLNEHIHILFLLEPNRIHPNLRSTVYCNAIAAGGVEEWDFGWEMFRNATVAAEAVKLRSALACTKVPWLLNRLLKRANTHLLVYS